MQKFEQEFEILLTKLGLLLPAIIAIMMKLAIDAKRNKFKIFNAFVSIFTGVGSAYLTSPYILANFSKDKYPIIIALIAIIAEKFVEWILIKIEDYNFFDTISEHVVIFFKGFFKK